MTGREFVGLPPAYLMLTLWGEKYRNYFYTFCLPSLLSPNNLPILQHVKGSKLIVSTTQDDWAVLQKTSLFDLLRKYVEPYFIDIGYPPPEVPVQLHMSKGHLMAARKAYDDGALAGFLAPDVIVSDGLVANALAAVLSGKKAVLAQALRFAMEPVVQELEVRGVMKPDAPMILPPRLLGSIAIKSLHSEIARYDFESPYYENYPIWSYWQVPRKNCIVMHTVSWALLLGDYREVSKYHDKFLQNSTIDGFYVYRNFARLRDIGEMHLCTDSDEIMFMSLTPESEMHFPLVEQPISFQGQAGYGKRLRDMRRFLGSDVLDPFRRWAYQVPVFIHVDDLDETAVATAAKSVATIAAALAPRIPTAYEFGLPKYVRWFLREGRVVQVRRMLRAAANPLIVPVLGILPRWMLRPAMRAVPRPFVRSVLYRLAQRPVRMPMAIKARQALRRLLGPLVVPILGGFPRPILKVALSLLPYCYVRPVVYRLSHPLNKEWVPLRQQSGRRAEVSRKGPCRNGANPM
jgi:hypothetical protein